MTETKMDDFYSISIPEYSYLYQNRKQAFKRKSGGIGLFVRNSLSKYFEKVDTNYYYVLWLKLNKQFTQTNEDFVFGVMYIRPS